LEIIKNLIKKYGIKGIYINNPFGIAFAKETTLKFLWGQA
jgi:hypothetical protein